MPLDFCDEWHRINTPWFYRLYCRNAVGLANFDVPPEVGEPPPPPPPIMPPNLLPVRERILSKITEIDQRLSRQEPIGSQLVEITKILQSAKAYDEVLTFTDMIPQLVSSQDTANTLVLGQTYQIRARALEGMGQLERADKAFSVAEHFMVAAGALRINR